MLTISCLGHKQSSRTYPDHIVGAVHEETRHAQASGKARREPGKKDVSTLYVAEGEKTPN